MGMYPIQKERIVAVNGKLNFIDLDPANKPYSKPGTDVRYVKFPKGSVTARFVYEKGAKVTDLVKKYGADFGINFPFFWDGMVLGNNEDDDKVISAAYGKMLTWWEFYEVDGEFYIGDLPNMDGHQEFVVTGAPPLIDKGNLCWDWFRIQQEVPDDIGYSSAQRTFVGLNADKDLFVFTADGRTGSDKGLTLEEMALYAQSKGCIDALNGDGGSSTILSDSTGTGVNQDQNTGVNETAVNHALLFFIKKEEPVTPPVSPTPVVDYREEGRQYLIDNLGLSDTWKATDPIDIGTLGALFKRAGIKKI
jgi:hypothetical protein